MKTYAQIGAHLAVNTQPVTLETDDGTALYSAEEARELFESLMPGESIRIVEGD